MHASKAGHNRILEQEGDEELAFAREASQGRLPKFVELLKFRNLSEGCKIWGCIMSVTSKELMVSMPDGLRGSVSIEEVPPPLPPLVRQHPLARSRCTRIVIAWKISPKPARKVKPV